MNALKGRRIRGKDNEQSNEGKNCCGFYSELDGYEFVTTRSRVRFCYIVC